MKKELYKLLSVSISIILIISLTSCGVKNEAEKIVSQAKDSVVEIADDAKDVLVSVKDKIVNWYNEIDKAKFQEGWDYASKYVETTYASAVSSITTASYIETVTNAINALKTDMNAAYGSGRSIAQEAGFAAERWHADTFNIDAAARGSKESASVVGSNELGSVDIETSYGENASLKYYKSGQGSASAQAKTLLEKYNKYANQTDNPMDIYEYMESNGYNIKEYGELFKSLYEGQTRIIPSDQMKIAADYLNGKINKSAIKQSGMDKAKYEAYVETLDNLKDRLKAPDGTQSTPATYEEMQAIAELSVEGDFNPEDFGITLPQVIKPQYVVKQAIGTGLSTAALKAALTIAPEMFEILFDASQTGEIDKKELEEVGIEGLIAGAEGFVEGSVCKLIVTMCSSGALGSALQSANPSIVASLAIIVIDAAINGFYLATGKITVEEYGNLMADQIIITMLSLPVVLVLSYFEAPAIIIVLGCTVGSMAASMFYYEYKDAVLEMIDGGGFEAVVPQGTVDAMSVAKDKLAELKLNEKVSDVLDIALSTANDGLIMVKGLVKK